MAKHQADDSSFVDQLRDFFGIDDELDEDDLPKLTAEEWDYIAAMNPKDGD
jgi:hypothetical protein